MSIEIFNTELIGTTSPLERAIFVRKYFFHGLPFVFQGREHNYYEFRQLIADKFNIGFHEVFIVGSSKLGFSFIKEGKPFDYESDIDVVLVNESLFERYSQIICDYQYKLDKNYKLIDKTELYNYHQFLHYLVKGWMRPDLLPLSFQVSELKNEWFDFFTSISSGKSTVGNYAVTAGLYKNYAYLEKYYLNAIEDYYNNLKIERESI